MRRYKTIKTLKNKVLRDTKVVRTWRVTWEVVEFDVSCFMWIKDYKSATFTDKEEAEEFFEAIKTCYEVIQQETEYLNVKLMEEE